MSPSPEGERHNKSIIINWLEKSERFVSNRKVNIRVRSGTNIAKSYSMRCPSVHAQYMCNDMMVQATSRDKLSSGLPTRPDTNQAVQTEKMDRNLKFRI